MSRNSNLLAFLLGAVTGGAVALLLAPEKGSVTREKIRTRAGDVYGKGRDWVDETQDAVRAKMGGAGEKAKGKLQDVMAPVRDQVDAVKQAVSEGKEAYRREMEKP